MCGLIIGISLAVTVIDTTLPVYKLEEIVVTATRIKSPLYNLPTNVDVITNDLISKSNAHTVAEAVEFALGITEVSERGTRGAERDVRIRSGGDAAKQVLVMIDGQPINDVSLGIADLDAISVDYVDRIEIVRGPASVLYGANALGGVINIITRKPVEGTFVNDFQTSAGSFGSQKYTLNVGVSDNKKGAFFVVNKDISAGWRENSDYQGNDFFVTAKNEFSRFGAIGFRFIHHDSKFGIPGQNTTPIEKYDGESEKKAQSPDARQKREMEYVQLEYENKIGNVIELKVKGYKNFSDNRYEYPTGYIDDQTQTSIYGTEFQLSGDNFLLGGDIHGEKCTREDLTVSPVQIDINKCTTNRSIFFQQNFSIGQTIAISGIRYDYHSVFGREINPRLSLICHPLKNLKLSGNVGRAFRAPTFEDLYSPYSSWPASEWGPAGDTKGNTELEPERVWGYDIGFEHQIRNIMLTQVTLFKNNINDLIQWAEVDPDTNYDKWRPSNVAEAYNRGVEVKIIHKIFQDLSQSLNCAYLESKGKKEGQKDYKTLMYTPPIRLGYRIDYRHRSGFNFNVSANFTERRKWEDDWGATHTLPSYTLANARVSQKIYGVEAFFEVKNASNKRYQSREYYPLPGRTFNFGASLKF